MWFLLCASNDVPALWVHQGLKAHGLAPLELVTDTMLGRGARWDHQLGADGVVIDVTLADGRRIRNDTVRGVINRLLWVPSEQLLRGHPSDREYATQEFYAFFMSWLYALPRPVLNRPTPRGLCGQWRHMSEWIWLATKAGLPTPEYRRSSRDYILEMDESSRIVPIGTPVNTLIVVKGHVVGVPAPSSICEGCQRLAEFARTELIGIEFTDGPTGPWTFAGATAFPDLRIGGEALLDMLISVLKGELEENE